MASRTTTASSELEHPPALSGTPTAWLTLILLALLVACGIFFQPLTCAVIRAGIAATAFWTGDRVRIGDIALTGDGWIRLRNVEWIHGAGAHPSSFRSEGISVKPSPLLSLLFSGKAAPAPLLQECAVGRSRLLVDLRRDAGGRDAVMPGMGIRPTVTTRMLPQALRLDPSELVVIGDTGRLSVTGLTARLPERWPGRISYAEATLDAGSWHRAFPPTEVPAVWELGTLRAGLLDLGSGIQLKDFSVTAEEHRLEFGFRGSIGRGLLRGDGAVGGTPRRLELTMVGESLSLDALADLFRLGRKATGEIAQARFTFRGDPSAPLEADSSLRLVARNFRWEGRGWESLRLSALLTGRNLTLGELVLRQGRNEVVAEGRSRIPGDWRLVTRAPFTAGFRASLEDAGALASLAGPAMGLPPLSGSLEVKGNIRGADNRAEGSCDLSGSRMKIRDLPLDSIRAAISFEGDRTRLTSLEARSGTDQLRAEGEVVNARPHAYRAKASGSVGDMARSLAQLGVPSHPLLGGGSVRGSWEGEGEVTGGTHAGAFRADVSEWVSRWTRSGISGSFEGSYGPGRLALTKADLTQSDLRLSLQLQAAADRLTLSDLKAVRRGTDEPLLTGSLSLPVDPGALVLLRSSGPALPGSSEVRADLTLRGIRAEELTQLLGQRDFLRGTLDGSVKASGTLAAPEIHTALRVAGFATAPADKPSLVTASADSAAGRLALQVTEELSGVARLKADLDLPFQAFSGIGRLALAGPDGKISGRARFDGFPLDGWAGLLGFDGWPLHGSRLEGETVIGGTAASPDLGGALTLRADRLDLAGGLALDGLNFPAQLTPGVCSIPAGSALFREHPVTVLGELRKTAQGVDGILNLSGKGLDLPAGLAKGLGAAGDAELSLTIRGNHADHLDGKVQVTGFSGEPRVLLKPYFLAGVSPRLLPEGAGGFPGNIPLNLSVRTTEPKPFGRRARVSLDMKASGTASAPDWSGFLAISDLWITWPPAGILVPETKLSAGPGGWAVPSTAAFGCTDRGVIPLILAGPTDALAVSAWGRADRPLLWSAGPDALPPDQGRAALFTNRVKLPWTEEPRWKAIVTSEDPR